MTHQPANVAASVRQRLGNLARTDGQDFQLTLVHYAIERLLFRLHGSRHAGRFVVKGAMLFRVWEGRSPRQTRDLDLLGSGDPDDVADAFTELATAVVTPRDGLVFDPTSVTSEPIRDHSEYRGVRVRIEGRLAEARIPLQVDVGFGDAVTPAAVESLYPTLLDLPAPLVRLYPPETVVAEKFQAIVSLGTANTRLKDYFDLARLAARYEFDGRVLNRSIRATFERRDTPLPDVAPVGLQSDFLEDRERARQWSAFVARSTGAGPKTTLLEAGRLISVFLMPATVRGFSGQWTAGGPWRDDPGG